MPVGWELFRHPDGNKVDRWLHVISRRMYFYPSTRGRRSLMHGAMLQALGFVR